MTVRKQEVIGLFCLFACSLALAAESSSTTNTSGTASAQAQTPAFLDAKSLMDVTIKNPNGDDIGKIHNVLFNPQNAEFFVTVDAGSSRYAVVPWKVLTVTSKGSGSGSGGIFGGSSSPKLEITMNTTKEALRAAPTLSEKQETRLNNPEFLQTVYQHYKVQPPTATGGSEGPAGGSSGTGSSSDSPGSTGGSSLTDTNQSSSSSGSTESK